MGGVDLSWVGYVSEVVDGDLVIVNVVDIDCWCWLF